MNQDPISRTTIPVRVDRSHLITIGRRLYSQSLELIRELVNNAYDADATEEGGTAGKKKKKAGQPSAG